MSSEETRSAVGDGWPLGEMTSPFEGVGPRRTPLDLTLLDDVDKSLANMRVQTLSPKSKRLHDFEVLVAAQKLERARLIEEAKAAIIQANSKAALAQCERDQARAAMPVPAPPGPTQSNSNTLNLFSLGHQPHQPSPSYPPLPPPNRVLGFCPPRAHAWIRRRWNASFGGWRRRRRRGGGAPSLQTQGTCMLTRNWSTFF